MSPVHPPRVAIVVPCLNEEASIPATARRLGAVLEAMAADGAASAESFVCFVDDGSRDATWQRIGRCHQENPVRFQGLKLSRNFGHQNALMAGMKQVRGHCDCVITIDADLQQDETRIPAFVARYREGAEVVLGVRRDRTGDTLFKKTSALLFYKLMQSLYSQAVKNHADYRLLGRRALEALLGFDEYHLFLRFLVMELGFPVAMVEFDTVNRDRGESKYSLARMLAFAWNGITSFSIMPLRLILFLGVAIFLFSMAEIVYILAIFLSGKTVPGWASTVLPIYLLSGLEMVCIGIIGEYIGKIYQEAKGRPRAIVEGVLPATRTDRRDGERPANPPPGERCDSSGDGTSAPV